MAVRENEVALGTFEVAPMQNFIVKDAEKVLFKNDSHIASVCLWSVIQKKVFKTTEVDFSVFKEDEGVTIKQLIIEGRM